MSKRAELPGNIVLEFPDDTPDDVMDKAVREHLATLPEYRADAAKDGGYTGPIDYRQQEDNRPTSFLQGVGEGGMHVVNNAAGYLDKGLDAIGIDLDAAGQAIGLPSYEQAMEQQKAYDAAQPTQGSGFGKFVGEAALTAATIGRTPGGPLAQGGAGGALLSDGKDVQTIARDAAAGAVGGVVGDRVVRGIGSVIAPQVNASVRRLLDAGIPLTPGQIVGQNGVVGRTVKRVEDSLGNFPLVGPSIRAARRRGDDALNRAATNRALAPLGSALPDNVATGHDAVAYAGDQLRDAYARVLPTLNGTIDRQFARRLTTIQGRADVPPEYQNQLRQVMDEVSNAFNSQTGGAQGRYTGRSLRDTSERLGDISAAWRTSDDPYLRRLGDVAQQTRDQLHALARRQNPARAAELRAVDTGYANLVRVERAAAGTNDGVFTAGQLKTAVRQSDRSVRKRQSARGQALMQDLSSDAATVLPSTVGEGGSNAVNSLLASGALVGGAAAGSPLAMGGIGAALGGMAAYTRPGQAALRYALGRNPGQISTTARNLLNQAAPASAVAGTISGVTLTQRLLDAGN